MGKRDEERGNSITEALQGAILRCLMHFTMLVLICNSKSNKAVLQSPHYPPKAYAVLKENFVMSKVLKAGLYPIHTYPNMTDPDGESIYVHTFWTNADLFAICQSMPNPRDDIDKFVNKIKDLIILWKKLPADLEKLVNVCVQPSNFIQIMIYARDKK